MVSAAGADRRLSAHRLDAADSPRASRFRVAVVANDHLGTGTLVDIDDAARTTLERRRGFAGEREADRAAGTSGVGNHRAAVVHGVRAEADASRVSDGFHRRAARCAARMIAALAGSCSADRRASMSRRASGPRAATPRFTRAGVSTGPLRGIIERATGADVILFGD